MKILVTGGSGGVGCTAVARLVHHGHEVKVIGRRVGVPNPGADYASCNITDFPTLKREMAGCEGVVHLAAIPHPSGGSGEALFQVNCQGSFNVYQAAADLGIRRVVSASSINAFGFNFGVQGFEVRYFPVDEEHSGLTSDAYSFSKHVLEEIAAYFWHRDRISGVCLRLPLVYSTDGPRGQHVLSHLRAADRPFRRLMELPDSECRQRVTCLWDMIEEWRRQRANENWANVRSQDPEAVGMAVAVTNFWTHINALDSAQAIEKALVGDYEGSHPIYVNDSHNATGLPSEALLALFFPRAARRRGAIRGTECLVSIQRARDLIGFEPEHSCASWFGHSTDD